MEDEAYRISAGERFDALKPESSPRYSANDMGLSRLVSDFFRDIMRFVPERKCWYVFNTRHWAEDSTCVSCHLYLKEFTRHLEYRAQNLTDEAQRDELLGMVKRLKSYHVRRTVLTDAQSELATAYSLFDRDPWLFNCTNGTLNLKTREFMPFSPADFITNMSNVRYDPFVTAKRWDRFIDEVCCRPAPDAENLEAKVRAWRDKADYLKKALGYALSGDTSQECMFMLYGPTTRNGKGTCMETMQYLMGTYAAAARPETLSASVNPQGPSDDLARLAGRRFVNMSEPDRKLHLNAAIVKSLTGNDTVTARFLYGSGFEFKPCFKLFINTNFRPRIDDFTVFTSGRMKVIPFERHFEEDERDTGLKQAFREQDELSGIFNWCLEGLEKALNEGLRATDAVNDATKDYAEENDSLGQFMSEKLERCEGAELRTKELREAYNQWCTRNGFDTESAIGFRQLMSRKARIVKKRPADGDAPTTLVLGWRFRTGLM